MVQYPNMVVWVYFSSTALKQKKSAEAVGAETALGAVLPHHGFAFPAL